MSTQQLARWSFNPAYFQATWEWSPWAVDVVDPPDGAHPHPARTASPTCVGAARCSALALQPDPQSAHTARDFARATLRFWALDEVLDDVAVAVSELVSNALRYGHPSSAGVPWQPAVWLGVCDQASCVVCAVADSGDDIPVVKEPDYLAESGRGLHVIASLSDAWGWTRDRHGKVVWAMFRVPNRPLPGGPASAPPACHHAFG